MPLTASYDPLPPEAPPSPRIPTPYTLTYILIALNALVFVAMVASGISFTDPTPLQALTWGADFAPLTVGAHQYWRILTSTFVHFGIIHIAFNMYVLYQIGPFIEMVFGRARYLAIYIVAGLGGSLVSLWIHPMSVGAGASGAIFGLYGAVFGFLLIKRGVLNPAVVSSIGKSAGIFVLYNIVYGTISRTTDLSAHFGGLITGFLIGMALIPQRSPNLMLNK
jgi:rhomboid protease GluP